MNHSPTQRTAKPFGSYGPGKSRQGGLRKCNLSVVTVTVTAVITVSLIEAKTEPNGWRVVSIVR